MQDLRELLQSCVDRDDRFVTPVWAGSLAPSSSDNCLRMQLILARQVASVERESVKTLALHALLSETPPPQLRVAQALSYEPAVELLSDLFDKVAISPSSLTAGRRNDMVLAVGMLAAAGLCDVSPKAVRLSAKGRQLVERLAGTATAVSTQE